jgi:hypothetical protein
MDNCDSDWEAISWIKILWAVIHLQILKYVNKKSKNFKFSVISIFAWEKVGFLHKYKSCDTDYDDLPQTCCN